MRCHGKNCQRRYTAEDYKTGRCRCGLRIQAPNWQQGRIKNE